MTNVFNNNISGGAQNIAQGSSNVSQTAIASGPAFDAGDTAGFLRALSASGAVTESDIEELREALAADSAESETAGPAPEAGPKVLGWLAKFGISLKSVGGKVALGGAGGVVAGLVKHYLGI